jgi:acetyl esterase/lipase
MLNEAGSKFNKIPKPFLIARIPLQFIFVMWAALYAFPQLGLLPEASSFEVIPHLVYKHSEAQDLTGDLYVPKNGNGKAVVVVHGGSWTSRRGDMTTLCEDLASRGFVAFNIRYRLAPENLYPKSVEDVFDAVQWLRGQAAHYKFNSDRVAGWGYSAGAHLILMAGLNPKSDLYAIVAGGTPSDFSLYPFSPLIRKYLGVTFQINPQLWREASPINHVSENPPPVFMYHGQWDILVSPEQMYVMEKELKSHHGRVETFLAPYMGHLATYFFSGLYFDRVVNFLNQ